MTLLSRIAALAVASLTLGSLARASEPNTLTPEETKAGWKLLFDGKTTEGWRGYKKTTFPAKGWHVEDGCLANTARSGAGDIITTARFTDFELRFEWRISERGNSGVKYLVDEDHLKSGSPIGFEYQLIDDERHPDAKNGPNRTTGALYYLIAPTNKKSRPAGEFNESRIVVRGGHFEHWLNGAKVVEGDLGSDAMKTAIAASKFKDVPGFGSKIATGIDLQDHGDAVAFRSIKIREFVAPR